MKKILIFSLAYYPHVGGAEVSVKEITDRISEIEFHMVTMNFGGSMSDEKVGNVRVHRIGGDASYLSKILFVPRAAFYARALHKEIHFDGFWALMSYMLFPIVLLRLSGVRVPYALTLQEGDPWEHMFDRWFILPFRPLLTLGFKNAAAVSAISTFLAEWAERAGFPDIPKVIPNGVDSAHFAQRIPEAHQGVRLVTTSRLVRKNGIDDVISALPLLPEHVTFSIFGIGPEEDTLKALVRTLGLEKRVIFMGHISHSEMPRALGMYDIFIRPSRSEGMGNSFIEAFAAGLPVIATQEGGISDFLFDAKRNPDKETTGWAVDKNSPSQIAEAVTDIVANPEKTMAVARSAKALASEKYDWGRIARDMRGKIFAVVCEQS